jgi:L-alanine-DL-glutamate epimerase-like enolase superfamily enzyme
LKISSIKAFRSLQLFVDGTYRMSKDRHADGFDSLIIKMTTDSGLAGWGEMSPLGTFYGPAFAAGARSGVVEIAPKLLGLDPRAVRALNRHMDTQFRGHPYIKSAFDMAAADLAARAYGVPLVTLLGGQDGDSVDLYRVVPHGTLEASVTAAKRIIADGYERLQLKVGGDVKLDIERLHAVAAAVPKGTLIYCDANAGWSTFAALQFADATNKLDYVFEQPCTTLDENRTVRRHVSKPMVLDESVTTLEDLLAIHRMGLADGITLKIARVGGVTRTRELRDLAVDMGLLVTVEDTGGAEIDTAAMAHLSLSTPKEHRMHAIAFHQWVTTRTAHNAPPVSGSQMGLPDGPGLGIDVDEASLGDPFYTS